MESKKINQLATELAPELSDLTIIGDPTTGISKKITLSQMASLFTGTVEEYASLAAFPLVGAADTIYIALDTNIIYRWNTGTNAYVELSPNIVTSLVFSDANGFDGTISLVGSTATLTITTALTQGSVPFIGASGALSQDNANLFFDDTNNRLGINTNTPTTALDVFGSGIIGRLNGTSTNNAFLGFASAGSNKWSIGNVQSDQRFRIYSEANTAELVSVLQTGEFGIGIANPLTKLHIFGGASALIANLDTNTSVAKSISFRSGNSSRINLEVSGTESGSNAGANLYIKTFSDAGASLNTPFTILRSSGYVGINIATPANKFAIGGSNSEASLLTYTPTTVRQSIINTYYSNAESLFPQYLDIVAYGQPDGTNGGSIIRFLTNPVTNASAAIERLRITPSGSVGINTIAPTTRLSVVGDSTYTSGEISVSEHVDQIGTTAKRGVILGYYANGTTATAGMIRVPNNGNLVINTSGGYVGIGSSTPNYGGYTSGTSVLSIAPTATDKFGVLELVGNRGIGENQNGQIIFANINGGTTNVTSRITCLNGASNVADGILIFETRTSAGTLSERMRIDADGVTRHKFASDRGIRMKGSQSSFSEIAGYQVFTENIRELRVTGSTLQFYTGDGSNSTGAEKARITESGFFKANNTGTYPYSSTNVHEIGSNVSDNTIIVNNSGATPAGLFMYYNQAPNGNSNHFLNFYDGNIATKRFSVKSNGGIENYQANNTNLSDERTKKEITPLESYWNKFKAIEIVKFKYIDQTHDDFNIGVIAQQLEKVAPEFVDIDGWDNGKPKVEGEEEIISTEEPLKSIYSADLYHATIKVLQEAMEKIEILEEKIKQLESK